MKLWTGSAVILAILPILAQANTDDTGLSLAKQNACMTCHAVDSHVVGPSFKAVAARYKGNKNAEAVLFQKIKMGGAGVWGQTAMPPYPQANDQDLHTIIKWVLAQ
ncbi:MAG: c-type cytochrome [Sulfuriferula sp.]